MKPMLIVMVLIFSLTMAVPAFATDKSKANSADYEAITKVIGLYLSAPQNANSGIMKPAFYKDAIMYRVVNGELTGGPIQRLFDSVDSAPKAVEIQPTIESIDIAEDIAYVRLGARNWNGNNYTDMFLLLKDKEGWRIMTKVFHNHKK